MMKLKQIWYALCHVNIVLGGMFLTFFWIDRFNTAMNFLGNEISKWLLLGFCISAMTLSIITIVLLRKHQMQLINRTKIITVLKKKGHSQKTTDHDKQSA